MKVLDLKSIQSLKKIELKTLLILEGFFSGAHRGNFTGYNLDFLEHRSYTPGDDLRYLNWKIWGKQDKLFLKKFEEETNLKIYIFLDISNSMSYKSKFVSKLEYAILGLASILYLAFLQQDYFSLITFSEKINDYFPPSNTKKSLTKIYKFLENLTPKGKTNFEDIIKYRLNKIKKKGLFIVISDFWETPQKVFALFYPLMKLKNEVMFLHILDENEINFNFQGSYNFNDLEYQDKIKAQAGEIREYYKQALQTRLNYFKSKTKLNYFNYLLLNTNSSFFNLFRIFLTLRKKSLLK